MNENKSSFFDKNTLVAIVLVLVVWMGWQTYMQKKYPTPVNTTSEVSKNQVSEKEKNENFKPVTKSENEPNVESIVSKDNLASEETFKYASDKFSFELTSYGMGIRNIDVHNYKGRQGEEIVLGKINDQSTFVSKIIGETKPLNFRVTHPSENSFIGVAEFKGTKITKILEVDPEKYVINQKIVLENVPQGFSGLSLSVVDQLHKFETGGMFSPSYEKQTFFVVHGTTKDRFDVVKDKELEHNLSQVSVLSLGTLYFATAITDSSPVIPQAEISIDKVNNVAVGTLKYLVESAIDRLELTSLYYAGPKEMKLLENADERMSSIIDFGFFSFLAVPMLKIMIWFFGFVKNWGLAIILLTTLVRMIVLPLNIMSYRSMKAMQRIQPAMQNLRVKYKDNPQTLNAEMMRLMKDNGANPLGGCLPMLLQLPVFFAIYQVFGQSIELYQSPFIFWIHDLSLKDPFYVLPVLMGVTMYIQQKITPTTMDPTQAKIFMFMPIIFTFMMVGLPSGLTLYIFINTLFGIIQQYLFMRDKKILMAATSKS